MGFVFMVYIWCVLTETIYIYISNFDRCWTNFLTFFWMRVLRQYLWRRILCSVDWVFKCVCFLIFWLCVSFTLFAISLVCCGNLITWVLLTKKLTVSFVWCLILFALKYMSLENDDEDLLENISIFLMLSVLFVLFCTWECMNNWHVFHVAGAIVRTITFGFDGIHCWSESVSKTITWCNPRLVTPLCWLYKSLSCVCMCLINCFEDQVRLKVITFGSVVKWSM